MHLVIDILRRMIGNFLYWCGIAAGLAGGVLLFVVPEQRTRWDGLLFLGIGSCLLGAYMHPRFQRIIYDLIDGFKQALEDFFDPK